MVCNLTVVCYVLDLQKSLITLWQLASMECKAAMEKDDLKISRGALALTKGDMLQNLYLLKGTTVLEESCVRVDSSHVLEATGL